MEDWGRVQVFGVCPEVEACVIRESAYGLVEDDLGRLAVVRTSRGMFLPGGGIEAGETPEEAITREALEECGLVLRLGVWAARAVQFVYSEPERTHFEKRSIFIGGAVGGCGVAPREADHELVWVNCETAKEILTHQSQRWAVGRWESRITRRWKRAGTNKVALN